MELPPFWKATRPQSSRDCSMFMLSEIRNSTSIYLIQGSAKACFCMVYKLRMVFTFLKGRKKNEEREGRRKEEGEEGKDGGRGRTEEIANDRDHIAYG